MPASAPWLPPNRQNRQYLRWGTVPREQEIDEQSEQWETIREREARWQRAVDLAVAAGLEREVAEQAVTAAVAELGPQAFQPLAARD